MGFTEILYNGNDTVVHFHAGAEDFVIITFMGLYHEEDAEDTYFLKPIAEKLNYTCIGITTKKQNWYVSSEMEEVISICRSMTEGKKVITFGPSMGGYAAIKYSNRLNADYVLALAPKFSIYHEDCSLPEHYTQYIKEYMKDMAIKPEDTKGEIYICYDPSEEVDNFQAYETSRRCKSSVLIPVFYAGHIVIDSLIGVQSIKTIMECFDFQDNKKTTEKLTRRINNIRRKNNNNIINKIYREGRSKPSLIYNILMSDKFSNKKRSSDVYNDLGLMGGVCFELANRNEIIKAQILINSMNSFLIRNIFSCSDFLWWSHLDKGVLITTHGSQIYYDPKTRSLCAASLLRTPEGMMPVGIDYDDGMPCLCAQSNGRIFSLYKEPESALIHLSVGEKKGNIFFSPDRNPSFCFLEEGGYLRCWPENIIDFEAQEVNDWEKIAFIPPLRDNRIRGS
ncbi:hypothetical protein OQ252_08410 [Acetobacter farinalis]|uniref:Alpha/beta hydrolase n=1 Tax=Acetobacter farinalis TaxID=1260984 RepID=A0ABT3Q7Z7_9PROT|nr:hypothetical protein [Acetobacter farinalis]MCX2561413.1 hypothetical protein [Acetobacter farinalis]NHO29981.1 hypothetical protein [Acetobacter farinalis]